MKNHLPQVGLVEDQIYGELYSSWQKDLGVKPTSDSQKSYREIVERCIKDREIKMQKERVGINMCITFSSMLQRSKVTKLDLYHNVIRDAGCETLAHYLKEDRYLLHLNLGGNDIGPTGINFLAMAVGSHPKLQTLILGSLPGDPHVNRIDSVAGRVLIEKCNCCETLKHIDLNRNPLGQSSQEIFIAIQGLISSSPTLQVLKLADTSMSSDSAMCIIEGLARSPSLSSLDISSNNLSSAVAFAIGKVLSVKSSRSTGSLKSLEVGNNPHFAGEGISSIFRSLGGDKGLTTLKVDNCGVDDGVSIECLCIALKTNTVLTHLDIKCNYMTEVGAVQLAKVLMMPNVMTHLSLSQNRIKDEGACAIATMVESNRCLSYLDLNDTWISDRGLVAFGVALANNNTLQTLLMNNNHISDDGGTAFVALLERNKSLLHCGIKGNSIFHSTVIHIDKITSKNRRIKSEEVPNKLRKEIIKLHYQMYKLEEAKSELANQKAERMKIERAHEEFEAKFRLEEAEFRKKQKELLEQASAAEAMTRSSKSELEKILEAFEKYEIAQEAEMTELKATYDADIASREKAQELYKHMRAEVTNQEVARETRLKDLRNKIDLARTEKEQWNKQTQDYRDQVNDVTAKLKELESQVTTGTTSGKSPNKSKKPKKKKGKGVSDIAALLDTA